MSGVAPTWLTAVVDLPRVELRSGTRLLQKLTGYDVSKGRDREFVALLPRAGDSYLRVQRLDHGPARVHLDVHVGDVPAAAAEAERLGASVRHRASYVVLDSPGGMPFCLVGGSERVRPPATTWPGGHHSMIDQVSVDVPRLAYQAECDFWSRLTGWALRGSPTHPEFAHLVRPHGNPLRVLLQRLDEPYGTVRAHLDWACDDRIAETHRHQRAGARVGPHRASWTVMHGPVGLPYCLTDRHPGSGQ